VRSITRNKGLFTGTTIGCRTVPLTEERIRELFEVRDPLFFNDLMTKFPGKRNTFPVPAGSSISKKKSKDKE
jgi:hypothetical protein